MSQGRAHALRQSGLNGSHQRFGSRIVTYAARELRAEVDK
jgi:hypothetical protein